MSGTRFQARLFLPGGKLTTSSLISMKLPPTAGVHMVWPWARSHMLNVRCDAEMRIVR
jgi:hypothetical protein